MFKSLIARLKLSRFIPCLPHLKYITLNKLFKFVDSILSSVHEDDNTINLMELVRGLNELKEVKHSGRMSYTQIKLKHGSYFWKKL